MGASNLLANVMGEEQAPTRPALVNWGVLDPEDMGLTSGVAAGLLISGGANAVNFRTAIRAPLGQEFLPDALARRANTLAFGGGLSSDWSLG